MDAPFVEGVPYFSKQEESNARKIQSARQTKTHVMDIEVSGDDTESLTFLQRVRSEIDAWQSRTDVSPTSY